MTSSRRSDYSFPPRLPACPHPLSRSQLLHCKQSAPFLTYIVYILRL